MNTLSSDVAERARKNQTVILQRLLLKTQSTLALELGVSEAKISRFKNEDLEMLTQAISSLGLTVVPDDAVVVEQDEIDALKTLAAKYFIADEIRRKKATNGC